MALASCSHVRVVNIVGKTVPNSVHGLEGSWELQEPYPTAKSTQNAPPSDAKVPLELVDANLGLFVAGPTTPVNDQEIQKLYLRTIGGMEVVSIALKEEAELLYEPILITMRSKDAVVGLRLSEEKIARLIEAGELTGQVKREKPSLGNSSGISIRLNEISESDMAKLIRFECFNWSAPFVLTRVGK